MSDRSVGPGRVSEAASRAEGDPIGESRLRASGGVTRASRLARECDKLDRDEERQLAEEGLTGSDDLWPVY